MPVGAGLVAVLAFFDEGDGIGLTGRGHGAVYDGAFSDGNCLPGDGSNDFCGGGNFYLADSDNIAFYAPGNDNCVCFDHAPPNAGLREGDAASDVAIAVDFTIDQEIAVASDRSGYRAAIINECRRARRAVTKASSLRLIHVIYAPAIVLP